MHCFGLVELRAGCPGPFTAVLGWLTPGSRDYVDLLWLLTDHPRKGGSVRADGPMVLLDTDDGAADAKARSWIGAPR